MGKKSSISVQLVFNLPAVSLQLTGSLLTVYRQSAYSLQAVCLQLTGSLLIAYRQSAYSLPAVCLQLTGSLLTDLIDVFAERGKQVPFSMAIGNVELMHECFPKRQRMGITRMK